MNVATAYTSARGKIATSYGTWEYGWLYKTSIQKFVSLPYIWPHKKAPTYPNHETNKKDNTDTSTYLCEGILCTFSEYRSTKKNPKNAQYNEKL
jgi:hypothetical protein